MSKVPSESRSPRDLELQSPVDDLEMVDVHHLHAPIMREKAEPRDGFEPIPLWLTVFYGIIVFWGGFYLASYSGGFRADIYNERRPLVASSETKEIDPLALGKRLYTINCSACHQATGLGVAAQFPPLSGSEWVVGDHGRLVRILLQGLQGPIEVLGETYNGNMPAFGNKLDDSELSLVLSYIRQAWENTSTPISADLIAQIRAETSDRRAAWTAAELKQITSPPLDTQSAQQPSPATVPNEEDQGRAAADANSGK